MFRETILFSANLIFCWFRKTNDQTLAYGLEYPLFSVLEEPIKNNIEILLDEYDWISERIICDLYNVKKKKKTVYSICSGTQSFLIFFLGKIWVFICSL